MDPGRSRADFNKEQQAGEHVLAADPAILYRELPHEISLELCRGDALSFAQPSMRQEDAPLQHGIGAFGLDGRCVVAY